MRDKKLQFLKFALFLGFFTFLIFSARAANAATLYFSPSSGNFTVGNIFTVNVLVNTQNVAINSIESTINFPVDSLEVVSVSRSGSIFSLWVEEPSFSNLDGRISLVGGLSTPGFNGLSGKIIGIVFRSKKAGSASLVFSSGAVRANDGYGTDISRVYSQAQFNLVLEEQVIQLPTQEVEAGLPNAPKIFSPTNQDSNKWYNNSSPKFTWSLSDDIIAVKVLYNKSSGSYPSVLYVPPISEKQLEDLKDGIYYFHVQLKNKGGWGAISHFKFQIDTESPEPFDIKFVDGKKASNPQPVVLFDTTDSLSGVDYYKVKIGEGDLFSVSREIVKSNPYTLPFQTPGRRSILVQAYDKAGNYTTTSEEFVIEPINSPVITSYPQRLSSGETLIVKGETKYPDGKVILWLQKENNEQKSFTIQSDQDEKFTFVFSEKLEDGVYKIWAEAVDIRGARSLPTESLTIVVAKPAFFRIGTWAINVLSLVIPLIVLIIALIGVVWYGWLKLSILKKKIQKEVREAESALHKAFDLLKEDIREQIKMLEKTRTRRQLTEEEEKIIKQLRKDLDDAEKFVKKEIEDIEKTVK